MHRDGGNGVLQIRGESIEDSNDASLPIYHNPAARAASQLSILLVVIKHQWLIAQIFPGCFRVLYVVTQELGFELLQMALWVPVERKGVDVSLLPVLEIVVVEGNAVVALL